MSETNCAQCGAPLADTIVGRVCPRCLLNEGCEPVLAAGMAAAVSALPRWFGEYELLEEIGRGGMGVVYRARQANLNRLVALKIPAVSAALHPELYQRFRVEAAAAARLRHPFIVAIHDSGEVDGQAYYVMDLIAGRNLEQLCGGRPLEGPRAATLLRQLAQAVHHAHVAGVVHRDLKPSNVLVDEAGAPHITDFGLARLVERSDGATVAGQMLGSPGYAAPEQVEGRNEAVGVASDVYSLGALGYHLATGRAPYVGTTPGETLRLMHEGRLVPPRALNPALPRDLEAILLKCLERDPARRYVSAAELATDLERFAGAQPVGAVDRRRTARWTRRVAWAAAAAVGGVAVWAVVAPLQIADTESTAAAPAVVHATIELPPAAPLAPAACTPLSVPASPLALSPDGATLAYVALVDGQRQLHVRPLDGVAVRALPGTEGAYRPVFSPDGRSVAFLTDSRLKRTSVAGGDVVTLCETGDDSYGMVWGRDGYIYWSTTKVTRVPETGGTPEPVPLAERSPRITEAELGTGLFFNRITNRKGGSRDYRSIHRFDLRTGAVVDLGVAGHSARTLDGRQLVFARGDGLFGVRLSADGRGRTGEPVQLLSGVQAEAMTGVSQYALAETGTLVYAEGGDLGRTTPAWVDRQGRVTRLPVEPRNFGMFELSPDGRWLAAMAYESQTELLLIDVATGNCSRVGEVGAVSYPVWSADGRRLFYVARREGRLTICAGSLDDAVRTATELYRGPAETGAMTLMDCDRRTGRVLFRCSEAGRVTVFGLLDPNGGAPVAALADIEGAFCQFSPDGRWVSSMQRHEGRSEVYVRRFPNGADIRVTFQGGEEARWSARGDELFYRYGSVWYAVPVVLEPEVRVGTPREIFRGPYSNIAGIEYCYDANTDRFLVLLPVRVQEPQTRLRVVVNWGVEVRRRLGGARR